MSDVAFCCDDRGEHEIVLPYMTRDMIRAALESDEALPFGNEGAP